MKRYWRFVVWISVVAALIYLHYREMWLGWVIGMVLALGLSIFDRLLYVFWLKPYEQLSIQIQYWIKRRDVVAAWSLLAERGNEQTRLVLRSAGFAILWPVLMIYVLTTTGSIVAVGIMVGLGLDLVVSIIADWEKPQQIASWFCWQIKRPFSNHEVQTIAGSFVFLWLLFLLLLLTR
jgi:hypothetical protein